MVSSKATHPNNGEQIITGCLRSVGMRIPGEILLKWNKELTQQLDAEGIMLMHKRKCMAYG